MMFHGWTATADLNWFMCFEELGKHFRVIAMDNRGHGRGIRTNRPFKLSDCADDAAALADQLGIESFIAVGYSMGGTLAQLMWKRHKHRVRGLVLCATAAHFVTTRKERTAFTVMSGVGAVSRYTPPFIRKAVSDRLYVSRKTMMWEPWAVEQVASHDWRNILEAGAALGLYDSRGWLPQVDVPTAIIRTTQDRVVDPDRQAVLAELIPGAHEFTLAANHDAVFARADEFVPLLVTACLTVHEEALARLEQS
jgi:3-oxoadipate enol-lactonase